MTQGGKAMTFTTGNANYAWILNMVSKLSDNGVAGFILANGAVWGGKNTD